MVSLKKTIPQNLADLGPFFSTKKSFPYVKSICVRSKFDKNLHVKKNHLSKYQLPCIYPHMDLFYFLKRGMILYSWLPIWTYPKKMVSLGGKKNLKLLKIWRNLGHFFHPKILSIRQNRMCQVKIWWKLGIKNKITYHITNCHSSTSRRNMWFRYREDRELDEVREYGLPKVVNPATKLWIYILFR